MRLIETAEDLAEGIAHLTRADRRLKRVARIAGKLDVRRREGGFPGLARIITGQQLSVASANAIWTRFAAEFPEMTPQAVGRGREPRFRRAGMSAAKIRTLRAIAKAVSDGLDIDALAHAPAEEAHARLCAVHGIGSWTADLYLMFCLGHADVFPVGDLALRTAVADAFGLEKSIDPKAIGAMAGAWAPWRSAAATLFWGYYAARRAQKWAPLG
jgi:DNA-3-methyladenine glycosylase II